MSEALRFEGRVAIVTGAGGGLGRAYALLLAAHGAKVVVNDLGGSMHGEGNDTTPADKVVTTIQEAGGQAVASYDSVEDGERIVQTALDTYGRIDIVINNAGILRDTSFHKMTLEDWQKVYQVHLYGSFRVTHAAWPYLREQRYGRVIMTSSTSGIYGNFGQANYSAAKLGLYGLANTLAIEGKKRNIHVNTIAPTAGSRLTETVLPADLVKGLKPDYVAPLVVYLCHESCTETGGIYEVGAGWMARLRWQRSKGAFFPLSESLTAEKIAATWPTIHDFTEADTPTNTMTAMAPIIENLKTAPKVVGNEFVNLDKALGFEFKPKTYTYTERDVSLYALSVGAAADPLDPKELQFVYELNQDGFNALPTFAVTFPFTIMDQVGSVPGLKFNPMMLLHGEQYVELKRPLPTQATLTQKATISHIYDKGKGALILVDCVSVDEQGEEVAFNQSSLFIRGIGNFNGERGPSGNINTPPNRPPDAIQDDATNENQALLYRLSSGDRNPLHVDPAMSAIGGFERPILHGLCTFGFAARAVLKHFCHNDTARFKSIKVRFSKHVFPGETIITEMWQESETEIRFQCKVAERGEIVLSNAAVTLHPAIAEKTVTQAKEVMVKQTAVSLPDTSDSATIFAAWGQRIQENPAWINQIGAIYQFHITGDGGGDYILDLKNGTGAITTGATPSADCTFSMAYPDFVAMSKGELDPQTAFMSEKLEISGDVMLSTKLLPLFKNEGNETQA